MITIYSNNYITVEYDRPYLINQGSVNRLIKFSACRTSRPKVFGYGVTEEESIYDLIHNTQPL